MTTTALTKFARDVMMPTAVTRRGMKCVSNHRHTQLLQRRPADGRMQRLRRVTGTHDGEIALRIQLHGNLARVSVSAQLFRSNCLFVGPRLKHQRFEVSGLLQLLAQVASFPLIA